MTLPTAWTKYSPDDETSVRFKYIFVSKFLNIAITESDMNSRVYSTIKNGNMSFIIRIKYKSNRAIALQFRKKAGRG